MLEHLEERRRIIKANIASQFGINQENVEPEEVLLKALDLSGLHKKIVTITRNGKTFQTTRWISSETGEPVTAPKVSKHFADLHGETHEKVAQIVDREGSMTDKIRDLTGLGIYHPGHIRDLTGADSTQVNDTLKAAGFDPKKIKQNFEMRDVGSTLPSDNEVEEKKPDLEKPEVQTMAISEIQALMGDKEANERLKHMKDDIIKKYGITVEDKWKGYEDDVNLLIDGELGLRSVMAYGTGGVGKTYTLEKVLEEKKLRRFDPEIGMIEGSPDYDYIMVSGTMRTKELQKYMYSHRNKLVIFDDCDSMWEDPNLINVLKKALDTSGDGRVQFAQRLKEKDAESGDEIVTPSTFRFNGKMIFVTNLSKQKLKNAGADPISESRAASSDLTMNMEQTLNQLNKILPGIKMKNSDREVIEDLTIEDKRAALDALQAVSPYAKIEQLNTRVLTGIMAYARQQRKSGEGYDQTVLVKKCLKQFGLV